MEDTMSNSPEQYGLFESVENNVFQTGTPEVKNQETEAADAAAERPAPDIAVQTENSSYSEFIPGATEIVAETDSETPPQYGAAPVQSAEKKKNNIPTRQTRALPTTSFGDALTELRKQSDISRLELAKLINIKEEYIVYLEENRPGDIPQSAVYIKAYIRRIASELHATATEQEFLLDSLSGLLKPETPEPLDPSRMNFEPVVDEKELKRQTRLAILLITIAALVVLLVAGGITALAFSLTGRGRSQEKFDRNQLWEVQKTPQLEISILPVPAGRTQR